MNGVLWGELVALLDYSSIGVCEAIRVLTELSAGAACRVSAAGFS